LAVCGEAVTGREAIEKARQLQPDIIVLDIHMPETDGLQAARVIRAANSRCEILILTVMILTKRFATLPRRGRMAS